ncbi:MAG: protein-disulfide reductase DsbD family protein [Chlamydiae bacterium]|nr:protein-disulfide reductase DsbD family protein [Chlamydiota bacterium]
MRILLLFALLLLGPLSAGQDQIHPVKAELLTSHQEIVIGDSLDVVIQFYLQEGWHTYWKNPGDIGSPISIKWELPPGFAVSPIDWPAPTAFQENGMTMYGYDKDFALMARVMIPTSFNKESFPLKAIVSWVACGDFCIPGKEVFEKTIFLGGSQVNEEVKGLIEETKNLLPQKVEALSLEEGRIVFAAPPGTIKAHFFPASFDEVKASIKITDDKRIILSGLEGHLKGVLKIDTDIGSSFYDVNHTPEAARISFLLVLLAAFGGGLILNLMPCVFPVLSIKVLSLIDAAGQSSYKRIALASSYGGGVILSFLAISGTLLLLRATGSQIGWGFQLQEPLFVAFLCGLFFLMGLNLFGLFEMGTSLTSLGNSNKQEGIFGSFLSGILATVVATPCTGPFLGSTLGLTLTLPAIKSLIIFAVMGLGLALPFMVLMVIPPLARLLPRPGAWMVRLKQAMGFLMMAAVLWLIWIFEAETHFSAVIGLLIGLLILSIAAWIWGNWGDLSRRKGVRFVALCLSLLLIGTASVAVVHAETFEEASKLNVEKGNWQTFNSELFERLLAEKKPVFIDFTAKWCLICQANKTVLYSNEVDQAFIDKEVVCLKADWTKGDPVITAYLQKFQRSGVPLYVYYNGECDEPIVFPETLTASLVLNALH